MALGSTQPLKEMSTRDDLGEGRLVGCRAANFATFTCRLSKILAASMSLSPQGLSRPVKGQLLYSEILRLPTRIRCDLYESQNKE